MSIKIVSQNFLGLNVRGRNIFAISGELLQSIHFSRIDQERVRECLSRGHLQMTTAKSFGFLNLCNMLPLVSIAIGASLLPSLLTSFVHGPLRNELIEDPHTNS